MSCPENGLLICSETQESREGAWRIWTYFFRSRGAYEHPRPAAGCLCGFFFYFHGWHFRRFPPVAFPDELSELHESIGERHQFHFQHCCDTERSLSLYQRGQNGMAPHLGHHCGHASRVFIGYYVRVLYLPDPGHSSFLWVWYCCISAPVCCMNCWERRAGNPGRAKPLKQSLPNARRP